MARRFVIRATRLFSWKWRGQRSGVIGAASCRRSPLTERASPILAVLMCTVFVLGGCSSSDLTNDGGGTSTRDAQAADSALLDSAFSRDAQLDANDAQAASDAAACSTTIKDYCRGDGGGLCQTPYGSVSDSWAGEESRLTDLCSNSSRVLVRRCSDLNIITVEGVDDGLRIYYDTRTSDLVRVVRYGFPGGDECLAGGAPTGPDCPVDAPESSICLGAGQG